MTYPSVLVTSACEVLPVTIIEKILNGQLPESVELERSIPAYKWHIDNKYYTSTVHLCAIENKKLFGGIFAENVEAIVIYFDSNTSNGLEQAGSWLPFLDAYEPEIKILVCKNCSKEVLNDEPGISKRSAQEWCIQRGFELVELEPSLDDVNPDDDFLETTGVERIRQALNAHQWPNLVLKSESDQISGALSAFEEDLMDPNSEDFMNLLPHMQEIKDKLSTMSGEDRKDAAEKIVRHIWRSLGGDEDDL